MTTIEIYQDADGDHRWRMKARNGRIIADSAEGYSTHAGILRATTLFIHVIGDPEIKIIDQVKAKRIKK